MTLESIMDNAKATIKIEGRLDTVTAPELEKEIGAVMEQAQEIVLDMAALVYISSAGLRVLLSTQKQMAKRGTFSLCNVGEDIMDILEMTGFSDILTIR